MIKSDLVEQPLKPNAPFDYDSFLRWTWASDIQRPVIYSRLQTRNYWDEGNTRTSVQERSR